jgi:hypothetical protein
MSTAISIKFMVFAVLASPAVWSLSQEVTPPATVEDTVTKPVEPVSVPIAPMSAPAPAAPAPTPTPAPIVVSFLDFEAFDDDLNAQLKKAGDGNVEVEFYSPDLAEFHSSSYRATPGRVTQGRRQRGHRTTAERVEYSQRHGGRWSL